MVDDNLTILKAASLALTEAGYVVTTRDQAVGTTVALMRERPDVVLLDVNMPLLEGDELVRSIRKREILRDIVVLLYSAKPSLELQQLAHDCGADGFVPKSVPMSELVEEVTQWMDKKNRRHLHPKTRPLHDAP